MSGTKKAPKGGAARGGAKTGGGGRAGGQGAAPPTREARRAARDAQTAIVGDSEAMRKNLADALAGWAARPG